MRNVLNFENKIEADKYKKVVFICIYHAVERRWQMKDFDHRRQATRFQGWMKTSGLRLPLGAIFGSLASQQSSSVACNELHAAQSEVPRTSLSAACDWQCMWGWGVFLCVTAREELHALLAHISRVLNEGFICAHLQLVCHSSCLEHCSTVN